MNGRVAAVLGVGPDGLLEATRRIDQALQLLGGAAREEKGPQEYVELGGAGRALESTQAMHQVRMLAEQGRIVEATLLAKRAFGWSTAEARQRIEQLAEPPA